MKCNIGRMLFSLPCCRATLFAAAAFVPGVVRAQSQLDLAKLNIKHVIIIMQENRSFDSYFGTFPGADGIALDANGNATACYPIKAGSSQCLYPFHDRHNQNTGAPHGAADALLDEHNGAMDGVLFNYFHRCSDSLSLTHPASTAISRTLPLSGSKGKACEPIQIPGLLRHDTIGYHTADELPNYWAYAKRFALQDHLFEPVADYSLPAHSYLTSAWMASCTNPQDPESCTSELAPSTSSVKQHIFGWSNITDLLDPAKVSWKYYLSNGNEPDCDTGEFTCPPVSQRATVASIWNPLPGFVRIQAKNKRQPGYINAHNPPTDQFSKDISAGTLPSISWIVPNGDQSEHPPAGVTEGMEYVTAFVNTVMQSAYWNNTVIFIAWDDWGGFLDHEPPPIADYATFHSATVPLGYGIRVPGLIISPWVKPGTIDHQVTSFDAYLRFIEDIFVASNRIGGPNGIVADSRKTIRESLTTIASAPTPGSSGGDPVPIGDLLNDFDFSQTPIPPLVMSTQIPTHFTGAIDTNGQMHFPLTWDTNTTGPFKGYNVKGSTKSGSGYTRVAGCSAQQDVPFTGTSCTDSGAISGTQYHYIISTMNADGSESPNSGEIDIMP